MDKVTQLRRLGLFDARVPRYTSYPTANHFGDTVGEDEMATWVREIPERSEISLYIHIPFCRRLCWFCACRTQGTKTASPVAAYVETLKREIAVLARHLPADVTLKRLHWGGGTPTLLSPELIRDLAESIAAVLPLAPDAEFSVEIDPNEIDEARLDVLAEAGLNRASIGVQDFDYGIQITIGREQSYAVTKETADALRARGIRSLNIDILYGLPNQTEHRISETVQKVLSLAPDRVALYGYAHVPWMARRQAMIPAEALPVPEARLRLYETAKDLFVWDGFREIGIDHFARPDDGLAKAADSGRLKRNFQGYTDDTASVLIGLGASSISRFPQGYAQNDPATSGYTARIREGRFATKRGHAMNREDTLRAEMIEALMCVFEIDFTALAEKFGIAVRDLRARLDGIQEAFPGMLLMGEDRIAIRPEARPLTRMIARYLDDFASGSQAHSAAI